MDILRLYRDFNVDHRTEGHKHTRPGWVNVPCPYCTGHTGYHLGWNIEDEYYRCWRCGWHPPVQTVSVLLNLPIPQTLEVLKNYGVTQQKVKLRKSTKQVFKLPTGTTALHGQHRQYLQKRGFKPDEIAKKWGVQGTGPLSKLGEHWYKHRLLIPWYWNGQIVSFNTRDITNQIDERYKACPKDYEVVEHKAILYGNQEGWGKIGICVEGEIDVWRFGDLGFSTGGITFTPRQVRLIGNIFEHVFIVYDAEIQAQQQARKLRAELRLRGVDAKIAKLPRKGLDPAKMTDEEAQVFINDLLGVNDKIQK